jgi:hypothetical protein
MVKRRNLSDLYQKGKLVIFDDGETPEDQEAPSVYIKKLNSIESEKALRKANAEKAKINVAARNPESEVYLSTINEVDSMGGREAWVQSLAEEKAARLLPQIEDELGAEEEWSKDEYLQGLMDAWEGGLKDVHFLEPTEDSERVWGEMKRFNDLVQQRYEGELARLVKDFDAKTDDQLRDLLVKQLSDRRADFSWLREYRRAELLFAVRDPDNHAKPYFKDMDDLNEIANEVFIRLVQEYQALAVDIIEGKDSPQTAASSDQSEQPATPETVPSSGPVAVKA